MQNMHDIGRARSPISMAINPFTSTSDCYPVIIFMIYLVGSSIILKIFSSCKCMTDGLLKNTH